MTHQLITMEQSSISPPCAVGTALVLFLSSWLFPLPLAIKERKARQEIIQKAGSDLPSATLPLIAVQSVTVPAHGGCRSDCIALTLGGHRLRQTGTGSQGRQK